MNWQEPNSIQLIVADLNEIAADAYRHRIRPVTKKGGGGAYNGSKGGFAFILPKKYEQKRRARFAIQALSADFILLQASSPLDALSTVSATVDERGQLKDISYPGSEPTSSDVQSRPPANTRHSTRTTTKVFEDL